MRKFEDDVVISGIGQSAVGRRLSRSALSLTFGAVIEAIEDAGLQPADIDALAAYPGGGTSLGPGFAGPSLIEVHDALGLGADLIMGNFEGPDQLGTGPQRGLDGQRRHGPSCRRLPDRHRGILARARSPRRRRVGAVTDCLRWRAGARQVPSAGVAAVSVGALLYVGCMLLRV